MSEFESFQTFLKQNIPLVKTMQLTIEDISEQQLTASAPLAPNINDKGTVFGGSSSALMTICSWSLIKYHLELHGAKHDVVVHQAHTKWNKAQADDLLITVTMPSEQSWSNLANKLNTQNRTTKINVDSQVLNQNKEVCSSMKGDFVILKQTI